MNKRYLILVVDDDSDVRAMVVTFLKNIGYQTAEAVDGKQAVEFCKARTPALILMDAKMPEMDGVTACSEIHSQSVGKAIPVIMITALNSNEEVDRAFAAGAEDYVTKPIHWAVLRHRIKKVLERLALEKALRHTNREIEAKVASQTQQLLEANDDLKVHQIELEMQNNELRQAYGELEKARDQWARLFNMSPLGLLLLSKEGTILEPNATTGTLFGKRRAELIDKPFAKFFTQESQNSIFVHLHDLLNGESPQVCEVTTKHEGKSGSIIQLTSTPLMEEPDLPFLFLVSMTDLSARKLAEEERDRFFSLSQDLFAIIASSGHFELINPSWEKVLVWTKAEMMAQTYDHFIHPEDIKVTQAEFGKPLTLEKPTANFQNRYRHKDGSYRWLEWNAVPSSKGTLFAVARDVTERKIFEERVLVSEERFRGAFESAIHGMALISPQGQYLKVNHALCDMVGYTEEELLAIDVLTVTHPDDLDADMNKMREMLTGTLPTDQREKRYLHKNGQVVWVHLSTYLIRNSSRKPLHFVAQIQDITKDKMELERMNSFREEVETNERKRLAHTLHDTAVQDLQVTLLDLKGRQKQAASCIDIPVDHLKQSIAGVTKTIQLLRDISTDIHPDFLEHMDMETAMEWKCKQMNLLCLIKNHLADDQEWLQISPIVKRNTFLIFQEALTNTVKHAGVGEVKVELKRIDARLFGMEISDQGQGFDPITAKIRPNGLGLSIMHERAQRINGKLQITSSPGQGTCITLNAPVTS